MVELIVAAYVLGVMSAAAIGIMIYRNSQASGGNRVMRLLRSWVQRRNRSD